MSVALGAPQRRMIHNGLDEYVKSLKAAKREASKSFLTITESSIAIDWVKAAREAVPQVLPDDHDGTFQLTDEVRMSIASGLLTLSAQLLKKRDNLASEYDVDTKSIQNKVDDIESLRASLLDQRDLFEFSSAYRDDPNNTLQLLNNVLPDSQMPTLEDISEWPFSWRKEAEAWASAVLESQNSDGVEIPPRPSFLPNGKQFPLL
jgi:hypothetical protein